MHSWQRIALVLAVSGLLSFLIALPLDMDRDGVGLAREWRHGSDPLDADSDGDGLTDGQEVRLGLPPTDKDADDDGITDANESPENAHIPDQDGDGVLDGDEGHAGCIILPDCDQDGLPDGAETGAYSPLNADSFGVGLTDAVVRAFEQAGQPAGSDGDLDGIPDAWEDSAGLIDWGPFDPQPGQRDLLVEFLKVTGPNSGRFSLSMYPAYDAVAQMFASERGIVLHWVETTVDRATEHRPGFLEGDDLSYYRDVLNAGQASTNPYVTSIVLNPQQEQEDLAGEVLGAAFLRSMIATVDYGSHTQFTFEEAESEGIQLTGGNIELSPSMESHILGAPREQLRQIQFASEGIVDLGESKDGVFIVTRQGGQNFRWDWQNDWFATAPNITIDESYLQLRTKNVRLDTGTLAHTIAHELGHTLGLCHAHDADCYNEFLPEDISQARVDSTTMSYSSGRGTLHFLESEWRQVAAYLTCPPQDPIRLLAEGAPTSAILEAKYEASFIQALSVRACGDSWIIEPNLVPDDGLDTSGTGPGGWFVVAYVVATVSVAAVLVRRFA